MIFIVLSGLVLVASLGLWQEKRIRQLEKQVNALEKGTVPDYEKAKDAAKAVDDFNSGITGILGFDPYQVLKAQRGETPGGDDR